MTFPTDPAAPEVADIRKKIEEHVAPPGEFVAFPKVPRLFKTCIATEKLDGTNACIVITDEEAIYAQSRKRIITPGSDNYGFAQWVDDNGDKLIYSLGVGRHYGEWYGQGIQRNYGLDHKRFALFNTSRWDGFDFAAQGLPNVSVVPTICVSEDIVDVARVGMESLTAFGSYMVPGFDNPEGVMVWHSGAQQMFKTTYDNDTGKWAIAHRSIAGPNPQQLELVAA